jgi:hypothetical protein
MSDSCRVAFKATPVSAGKHTKLALTWITFDSFSKLTKDKNFQNCLNLLRNYCQIKSKIFSKKSIFVASAIRIIDSYKFFILWEIKVDH